MFFSGGESTGPCFSNYNNCKKLTVEKKLQKLLEASVVKRAHGKNNCFKGSHVVIYFFAVHQALSSFSGVVLAKWGDSNTNNTSPVPEADGVTNNTADVLKEPLGDDSSQTGLFLGSYAALGFGQVHKSLSPFHNEISQHWLCVFPH